MGRRSLGIGVAVAGLGLVVPWLALASPAGASPTGMGGGCSAGARTLAAPGSLLYPETGAMPAPPLFATVARHGSAGATPPAFPSIRPTTTASSRLQRHR